jgi:hypothetical protein
MLGRMRQASLVAPPLLVLAVFAVLSFGASSTTSAKPPDASPGCGQRGRVVFDADTVLVNEKGVRLGRFSGGESAVTFVAPPEDGSGLVRIETGTGRGSFRIAGFVNAKELRLYAAQQLPVASGHVWLARGTRVVATGTSAGKVVVEKQLSPPFEQRVTAAVDCSALGFTSQSPAPPPRADSARVFLLDDAELELHAAVPPVGAPSFTLHRASSGDQARFYSREQRGGFVHVQYQGELVIDAWAKASALRPQPRGTTADVPSSSYSLSSPPRLQLAELPRVVRTRHELPLRLAPREADPPIGVVETDTEAYVMEVNGDWTKVLPKSLHVLPDGDGSFWVRTAELEK